MRLCLLLMVVALGSALSLSGWSISPSSQSFCPQIPCAQEALSLDAAGGELRGAMAIDDRQIIQKLEQVGSELFDQNKTVPVAELVSQLNRKQCELPVAAAPATAARLAPADVYARCKSGVVVVAGLYKCTKCTKWHANIASGFMIASGVLVTNYHVIVGENIAFLVAMTADGDVLAVKEVLAASKCDDTAICRLDGPCAASPLALADAAPVGSPISVISHPDGRFYSLSQGIVSRYYQHRRDGMMMQVTADFARGSSGGPVLNDAGQAVGFVCSTVGVYYRITDGKKEELQMVFKQCVPASAVLKLIKTGPMQTQLSRANSLTLR